MRLAVTKPSLGSYGLLIRLVQIRSVQTEHPDTLLPYSPGNGIEIATLGLSSCPCITSLRLDLGKAWNRPEEVLDRMLSDVFTPPRDCGPMELHLGLRSITFGMLDFSRIDRILSTYGPEQISKVIFWMDQSRPSRQNSAMSRGRLLGISETRIIHEKMPEIRKLGMVGFA